jgi:hypothetical protein
MGAVSRITELCTGKWLMATSLSNRELKMAVCLLGKTAPSSGNNKGFA